MLLPDFALEQVRLRVRRGERGIAAGERRAAPDGESVVGIEGEHGDEARACAFRHAEPRAQPRAAIQFGRRRAHEFRRPATRALPPREAGGVGQQGKWSGCAHGVGKSCATAADQASRNIAGVKSPSHNDRPSSTSGGTITPAVSTKRLPLGFARRARASVHDAEDHAGQPEEREQQAAEKHRGGGPVSRSERGAHHLQFAEERTEGRAGRDREHSGDKNRRRARRQHGHAAHFVHRSENRPRGGCCPRSETARPWSGCCSTHETAPPHTPAPPSAAPMLRMPMCSTLEYASMRLKSRVPNRNNAATSIENNPMTSSVRSAIAPSPAASDHRAHAQDRGERHRGDAARQHRAHDARRLAIGVGLPGVHRSEAHLGAVADEQQHPRGQHPRARQARALCASARRKSDRRRRRRAARRSPGRTSRATTARCPCRRRADISRSPRRRAACR